jgi:excisionase family DNA binding protein
MKVNTEENNMLVLESGLMGVKEAANFLRLKISTVRAWILRRKIRYVKLGGRVFLRKADLENLIAESVVEVSSGG